MLGQRILPLLVMLACSLTVSTTARAADKRLPVPALDDQRAAESTIKELFATEYRKPEPTARVELAKTLVRQAAGTTDDVAAQYVLYREARDLAAAGGDAQVAVRAVAGMGARFDIDVVSEKLAAIRKVRVTTPESAKKAAESGLALITEAISLTRMDELPSISLTVKKVVRRAKDPGLTARATEVGAKIPEITREWRTVEAMVRKLETSPDDEQANAAAGRFFCLTTGCWRRGLPMLAKGSDTRLKLLAKLELTEPNGAEAMCKLGDGWTKYSSATHGAARDSAREHGLEWYRRALPGLSGLSQARVRKIVQEADVDEREKTLGYKLRKHPPDAKEHGGHYYTFINRRSTWAYAKNWCRMRGGYLACVETAEEARFIGKLVTDGKGHHVMLGGEKHHGTWSWVNGSPFEYERFSDWTRSHGGKAKDGICATVWGSQSVAPGQWGVKKLTDMTGGFICEWER